MDATGMAALSRSVLDSSIESSTRIFMLQGSRISGVYVRRFEQSVDNSEKSEEMFDAEAWTRVN